MLDLKSKSLKNTVLHRFALLGAICKDEYTDSNQSESMGRG